MITQAQGVPNIKTDGAAVMTVYSKKWNARYWQTGILPDITTSKFFDELDTGDEVDVTAEPSLTFKTYQNGQDLAVERVNLSYKQLKIDQSGYFNVALTDVDAKLSHLDLGNKYLEVGQKEGQKYIDTLFFAAMVDEADASNKGTAAGKLSSKYPLGTSTAGVALNTSNIVRNVTQLQTVLMEQVAAGSETWCVIPPWMHFLLVNSELKNAMLMGDAKSALRTGFIGILNNMKFFVNTYISGAGSAAATPSAILAGNKDAICYSLAMSKAKKYQDANFQTLLQGLMVWGWKVAKPDGLVNAYFYMGAEA